VVGEAFMVVAVEDPMVVAEGSGDSIVSGLLETSFHCPIVRLLSPALRLSPRPQEFVHRIDRSDDANAALVEVLAALKLSSSCVT
jgi:hypothetical protein